MKNILFYPSNLFSFFFSSILVYDSSLLVDISINELILENTIINHYLDFNYYVEPKLANFILISTINSTLMINNF
jgi:hypothetical protein